MDGRLFYVCYPDFSVLHKSTIPFATPILTLYIDRGGLQSVQTAHSVCHPLRMPLRAILLKILTLYIDKVYGMVYNRGQVCDIHKNSIA